jgi:Fe2+ or Zn2+ uptake regulation protein
MCLADLVRRGERVQLADDPPHEFVFGVIERFWAGETRWAQIDAAAFSSFGGAPNLDLFQNLWHTSGMPGSSELERMLRGASLRVTRPRVAVLAAVHDHPHADTHAIIGVVREHLAEVSVQAVYDVLRALTDAGLVRRIHPPGSVARYESRVGDNHHHVVCRSCGVIADVDCAVGAAPCLTPSSDHGFAIDEAEVIYSGLCTGCSGAGSS